MNPFFSDWVAVMAATMVSGSLMATGIFLLFRFMPRGSTELRAWLWWMVSVKFLLGLFLSIPLSIPLPASPTLPPVARTVMEPFTGAVATAPVQDSVTAGWSYSQLLVPSLFLLWVIGIVVYAAVFVRQVGTIRRILRDAEPLDETPVGAMTRRLAAKAGMNRPPRVVLSDMVTTPLTTNPFRPVVVLPAALLETLSDSELEMTLAHELAHIRRGDLLLAIPLTLAQAAFWFFPPVWFCVRAWDTARESACDEMALTMTEATPARYGDLLIKVVEADYRPLSLPALGVSASFHTLKFRLGSLGAFTAPRPVERPLTAILFLIGLMTALPIQVTAQSGKENGAKNLVQNAGFEAGTDTPTGWQYGSLFGKPETQVARDTAIKRSGRASLRFTKTAQTFVPVAFLGQTLPPVPAGATKMRFRVWVKAKEVRKATVAVLLRDDSEVTTAIIWGAYIGEANDGDKPANHDWKAYEAVVPLPAGTRSVTIAPQMYGAGTVWFDDLSASYENGKEK